MPSAVKHPAQCAYPDTSLRSERLYQISLFLRKSVCRREEAASKPAYKPRSVRRVSPPGDHLSWRACCHAAPAAYPRFKRSEQNRSPRREITSVWPCFRRGLPGRPSCGGRRWSLTPPFHPRPFPGNALLCGPDPAGHPAPGITRRRALCSADFPRFPEGNRDRPTDLDTVNNITWNSWGKTAPPRFHPTAHPMGKRKRS
jgi:hypothetical protein